MHNDYTETVQGRIMHELKVSALSALRPTTMLPECTNSPVLHKTWCVKYSLLCTYPKQLLVFVKCIV